MIIIIIIITNSIISVVVPKLGVKNVASDVAGSPAVPLRHNVRAGMRIIYNNLTTNIRNIAKGTTDPGVDYFNQLLWFGLVGLV